MTQSYPIYSHPLKTSGWSYTPAGNSPPGYGEGNVADASVSREYRTGTTLLTGGTGRLGLQAIVFDTPTPLAAVLLQHTNAKQFTVNYRDKFVSSGWTALPMQQTELDPWGTGRVLFELPPDTLATDIQVYFEGVVESSIDADTLDGAAFYRLGAVHWFSRVEPCTWAPTNDGLSFDIGAPEISADYASGLKRAAVVGPSAVMAAMRYEASMAFGDPTALIRRARQSALVCVKWPAPSWAVLPLQFEGPRIEAATIAADIQAFNWTFREVVHALPAAAFPPVISDIVEFPEDHAVTIACNTDQLAVTTLYLDGAAVRQYGAAVAHSLSVTDLPTGTTYQYEVRAVSSVTGLVSSATGEITTTGLKAPVITGAEWAYIAATTAVLKFTSDEPGTATVSLDNGASIAGPVPMVAGQNVIDVTMAADKYQSNTITAEGEAPSVTALPTLTALAPPTVIDSDILTAGSGVTATFDIADATAGGLNLLMLAWVTNRNGKAVITEDSGIGFVKVMESVDAAQISGALFVFDPVTFEQEVVFRSTESGSAWTMAYWVVDNAARGGSSALDYQHEQSETPTAYTYAAADFEDFLQVAFMSTLDQLTVTDQDPDWVNHQQAYTAEASVSSSVTTAIQEQTSNPPPVVAMVPDGAETPGSDPTPGGGDPDLLGTELWVVADYDPADDYETLAAKTMRRAYINEETDYYQVDGFWYVSELVTETGAGAAELPLTLLIIDAENNTVMSVTNELRSPSMPTGARAVLPAHPPRWVV